MNKKYILLVSFTFLAIFTSIIYCFFTTNESENTSATSKHSFDGKWITTTEFEKLPKIDVFHRQLDTKKAKYVKALADKIQNRHILFRKEFELKGSPRNTKLFFSADDYAKIYINGNLVAMGPSAGDHFN